MSSAIRISAPDAPGIQTYPFRVSAGMPPPRPPCISTWTKMYRERTKDPAIAPTTTGPPPSGNRRPTRPTRTNAARVPAVRRERDEVQDRGVQDDLDRHEDDDGIAASEDPVQPDAEEHRGEEQLVLERDH